MSHVFLRASANARKFLNPCFTTTLLHHGRAIANSTELVSKIETLQDFGLASSYTPWSAVQFVLEFGHNAGLPWWATIVGLTFTVRMLLTPVMIRNTKTQHILNNNMPKLQILQERVQKAKGIEKSLEQQKLNVFMQKHFPVKSLMKNNLLFQGPLAFSIIYGVRQMTDIPIPSLAEEKLLWIANFAQADHYLAMLTVSSIYLLSIFGGSDLSRLTKNPTLVRIALMLPCAGAYWLFKGFPAAMMLYIFVNTIISIIQTRILKLPSSCSRFNIPPLLLRL